MARFQIRNSPDMAGFNIFRSRSDMRAWIFADGTQHRTSERAGTTDGAPGRTEVRGPDPQVTSALATSALMARGDTRLDGDPDGDPDGFSNGDPTPVRARADAAAAFGNDSVTTGWRAAAVKVPTSGAFTILGTQITADAAALLEIALAGNDTLYLSARADRANGYAGHDSIYGRGGNDHLSGGPGADLVKGQAGDDILHGDAGADELNGGSGNDRLYGGDNRDWLVGGSGDDRLYGGDGIDDLFGGTGNDILRGGGGTDFMWGGGGNDILYGGRDFEILHGDRGDDILYGGGEFDSLLGDEGNDELHGQSGPDKLWGGDGNDLLLGGKDNDRLWGDAGDDELFGGVGWDRLRGGDGADTLSGGLGNDRLRAGADDDPDRFIYHDAEESLPGADNHDIVYEFVPGDDLIALLFLAEGTAWTGTTATANAAWYTMDGANAVLLRADIDGDAVEDFEVRVSGLTALTAADIAFGPL